MNPDRDIWAAALLIVKRYGDDAMLEAAQRADRRLDSEVRSDGLDRQRSFGQKLVSGHESK